MRPQALLPTEGTCEEIWMLKSFPLDLNREEGSCGWGEGEGAGGGGTQNLLHVLHQDTKRIYLKLYLLVD